MAGDTRMLPMLFEKEYLLRFGIHEYCCLRVGDLDAVPLFTTNQHFHPKILARVAFVVFRELKHCPVRQIQM